MFRKLYNKLFYLHKWYLHKEWEIKLTTQTMFDGTNTKTTAKSIFICENCGKIKTITIN